MMHFEPGFRNSDYTCPKPLRSQCVSAIAFFSLFLLAVSPTAAQTGPDYKSYGQPVTAAPPDPAIRQALAQISPGQIRRTIDKLVSFNNRNTLSSTDTSLPAGTGVTAAADWLQKELQLYSSDCGGCLQVKMGNLPETPQYRISQPTPLTNEYAALPRDEPPQ